MASSMSRSSWLTQNELHGLGEGKDLVFFCFVVLSYWFILFVLIFVSVVISNETKNKRLNGKGNGEDLEDIDGGKNDQNIFDEKYK